ncbi:MAG TPA: M91 family zinc metallopeptidase [Falsiroseomonas sp.]|jgi:hypothetical protein|nr:M91 family zinc metallopeptidase [Falsiroseomonas sp.]
MPKIALDVANLKGIYIETGDASFTGMVAAHIVNLRSKKLGQDLLEAISTAHKAKGHSVLIAKGARSCAIATHDISDSFLGKLAMTPMTAGDLKEGTYGMGLVQAVWADTVRGKGGASAVAQIDPKGGQQDIPEAFRRMVTIGHELIHALHFISADCARSPEPKQLDTDTGLAEEEARTVGLGPYDFPAHNDTFCENAIRDAFGFAQRAFYSTGNNLSHVVRT